MDKGAPRQPRNWPSFPGKPEDRASGALSRLEDITRLVTEIIWETDEQVCLTFVSDRAFEILGMPPQTLIGKKLTDLGTFFSTGQTEMDPNWDKPFRDLLYKINDTNGNEKTFLVSGLPHFDKTSWQFKGIYGTAVDITDTLESEKSLRMLSEIIEQNPAMVFVTDLKGNIEYVNAMFTEMSGYSRDEVIGQNPRFLKSGDTPQNTYEELWKTIVSGEKWQGELKDTRKDGAVFWANVTISPIREKDGSINRFVAVHEDITERKTAEALLTEAKNKAEVANRVKSEILNNTSHELRTPLNAIIGFSGSIKEEIFGPLGHQNYADYIDIIHQSGEHLLALINDILDVASLDAAQLTILETTFSISECVEASIRLIAPLAEKNSLSVSYSNNGHNLFMFADERRILQIMLNLLSNAVKFTSEGGEVNVTLDDIDDGGLCLSVIDTGIGMNQEDIAKALTQFGQVESDLRRKYEGTGLGLPLARGLVELHDGTLEMISQKGEGTTVKVLFPKARIVSPPLSQ